MLFKEKIKFLNMLQIINTKNQKVKKITLYFQKKHQSVNKNKKDPCKNKIKNLLLNMHQQLNTI